MDSIPEIQALIDSIQKVQYNSFIKWGVTYDLDMLEFSSFSLGKQDLAKEMLEENLNVVKTNQFPEKQFPTIIYHHGMGGISFEILYYLNSLLHMDMSSFQQTIIGRV